MKKQIIAVILAISLLALPVMATFDFVQSSEEPDQSPDISIPDFSSPTDIGKIALPTEPSPANNCDDAKAELSDWLVNHGLDTDSAPQASSDIFDSYGLSC